MQKLDEQLWILTYPLKVFGADIIRNVALIALDSGKLLIHSTAPFASSDVKKIRSKGEPSWLVEAMLDHDTFSSEGQAAFPQLPYFAPEGFDERVSLPVESLQQAPEEWFPEVEFIHVEGNPSFGEHVFLHKASRTLIVADLIFNYHKAPSLWTKILLYPAMGFRHAPGMSKRFRSAITDKEAFRDTLTKIFEWDFDRIIVGHGQVIESNAKEVARRMFRDYGYLP